MSSDLQPLHNFSWIDEKSYLKDTPKLCDFIVQKFNLVSSTRFSYFSSISEFYPDDNDCIQSNIQGVPLPQLNINRPIFISDKLKYFLLYADYGNVRKKNKDTGVPLNQMIFELGQIGNNIASITIVNYLIWLYIKNNDIIRTEKSDTHNSGTHNVLHADYHIRSHFHRDFGELGLNMDSYTITDLIKILLRHYICWLPVINLKTVNLEDLMQLQYSGIKWIPCTDYELLKIGRKLAEETIWSIRKYT